MSYVISNRVLSLGLGTIMFCFQGANAHEREDSRVSIELEGSPRLIAGTQKLVFQLLDTKTSQILTDENLEVIHEKKVHFFVFDRALKEYSHLHPEFVNQNWQIEVSLPKSGEYFLWTQGKIASDQEEFTSFITLTVVGGLPANPTPPVLGNVRAGEDRISKVTLSGETFRAGRTATANLTFTRTDGTAAQLTPFLGALAHVVIVSSDGDQFIHAHPMDHGVPNQLMLHTLFPASGEYRLWVQYFDHMELKTVALSVLVR